MEFFSRVRDNISRNNTLWILLWFLLLLNIFAFITLGKGFSLILLIVIAFLGIIGAFFISLLKETENNRSIPEKVKVDVDNLMLEIRPLCEDIFDREINRAIKPLTEEMRIDFHKGLAWLWEQGDEFIQDVEAEVNDTYSVVNLIRSLSEEKYKLITKVQENLDLLKRIVAEIQDIKEKDGEDLDEVISNRSEELKEGLQKEKEIFYEYIYKLLVEQVKNQTDDIDVTEYFDVYKLGEQFSAIIDKSLESRLVTFHDTVISDLENFSADVVGKMQKYTLQIMNAFKEVKELIDRLIESSQSESNLILRRLHETRNRCSDLEEKAGEIMVTLAWHDILLEKRWQEIKDRLYLIKDQVVNNVEESVIEYIKTILDEQIPGFSHTVRNAEGAVFYKSLIDAELLYQIFKGRKLPDILDNGVYALLHFVRPVELLASKSIRLTEEGIQRRKTMKKLIKNGEYQVVFVRLKEVMEKNQAELLPYLDDLFPRAFYAFCNNPYVKPKPDNLNMAAWSLFMLLIENEASEEELYLLTGLLLVIYRLRNKSIHPLKNTPLELTDENELDYMRYACYKAVSIIMYKEVRGIARLSYKFK